MLKLNRAAVILIACAAAVPLTGCAHGKGAKDTSYVARDVASLYGAAKRTMDQGDYATAAKLFDEVERQHPYSEWARRAQLMSAFNYYLAQKYTVDVSDPNAGYLMTPWQATLARDGAPELRYRTRIVLRFLGDDWKQLTVRAEANWLRGEEWEVGYDAALLDSVSTQLTGRLGKHA